MYRYLVRRLVVIMRKQYRVSAASSAMSAAPTPIVIAPITSPPRAAVVRNTRTRLRALAPSSGRGAQPCGACGFFTGRHVVQEVSPESTRAQSREGSVATAVRQWQRPVCKAAMRALRYGPKSAVRSAAPDTHVATLEEQRLAVPRRLRRLRRLGGCGGCGGWDAAGQRSRAPAAVA